MCEIQQQYTGLSFLLISKRLLTLLTMNICISPNVGRYFGLVTGPPPPPAMEAMEAAMEAMEVAMEAAAAATERFLRLFVCLFVNSIPEKLLDGFRRNLVGGLGMVQGSCH